MINSSVRSAYYSGKSIKVMYKSNWLIVKLANANDYKEAQVFDISN